MNTLLILDMPFRIDLVDRVDIMLGALCFLVKGMLAVEMGEVSSICDVPMPTLFGLY